MGGIAEKAALMRLYADILGKPLAVSLCSQSPALGSAIYAAGSRTGSGDIFAAVREMSAEETLHYFPDAERHKEYEALYQKYHRLHDLFGREVPALMEDLTAMRRV